MAEDRPYVARPEDVAALADHWQQARNGERRLVRLVGPFGGGRRALVAELLREVRQGTDDVVVWRVACNDQENGLQWLISRMFGALVTTIAGDAMLRGKVEMALNAQLPAQTKRVQGWYQGFVNATKEARPDANGNVQLRIPQDNPLVGLVEIVRGIARKIPVVLELQTPYVTHSLLVAQLLEALLDESKGCRLLAIVQDEPDGEVRSSTHPAPLLDLWERRAADVHTFAIAPWGETETNALLASRGLSSPHAARIAAIAGGRPGFVAELVEILAEKELLQGPLDDVSFASLTPMGVDEDELEAPPKAAPGEGERRYATAADGAQVAYLAALLGQAFPAALVAELGGYDKESIDDLLDAMGDLFTEVQFQESMGTWIYRFQRGAFREGVLEQNDTEAGHELARRVGVFLERFLAPRGLGFVVRTCRIYGEHGAPNRAAGMRALALTQDDPNAWGLAYELMRYFDETPWPDTARRTVITTLLEHMVQQGPIQAAENIQTEADAWAKEKGDEGLQAWLALSGSKLDLRRQDLFRARERAHAALDLFTKLGDKAHMAEVHAHLAGIALSDGRGEEALKEADASLQAALVEQPDGNRVVHPSIAAQAEMIRGVVARRAGKPADAVEHFKKANEIAGNSGLGLLAVDAGVSMGESLLAAGQLEEAIKILSRVLTATRQLGNAPRERATCELLAQAEGTRRNFGASLQLAQRCLQISQQLGLKQAVPVDLYHVGFFQLTQNKGKEALQFFEAAEKELGDVAGHPIHKDLWYHAGLAALQAGEAQKAGTWLTKAVPLLGQAGEGKKLVTALDQLAALAHRGGNVEQSKQILQQALSVCDQADLKDEKRALAKRLESLAQA